MLAMCVWKERGQSDDADNIRRVATTYRLDSDLCADQYGGAENAGVENAGVDCRGGKCRSGKYRSDNVWKAVKQKIKILNIFN